MTRFGEGTAISNNLMDAIVCCMDDEVREQVHMELAPCTNEEFLRRYSELAPDFEVLLKEEFGIEF
jgi:hypothetical protein